MTDDQRDQQDRRLAEALAVPPLDDVTRRRLVRNALDAVDEESAPAPASAPEKPEKRSWAPLAAAAVVILLVLVGVVALSRGGNDPSSDTAAREQRPPTEAAVPGTESATAGAADAAGSAGSPGPAASYAAGTRLYGELGDLSIPATRAAVRAAIAGANPPSGDVAESVAARVAAAECAASLRAADTTVVGIGTATVDGHDAAVVVTRAADGGETASVLVFTPCSVTPL